MSTLRIKYPQWQGFANPDYVLGCDIIECTAPRSCAETVSINVEMDFEAKHKIVNGVMDGDILLRQMNDLRNVLKEKNPDKLIVFGGDCSVSQVPMDYLHGKYGNKLGLIWLDAHPDISDFTESNHLNEMVAGNLLGRSMDNEITRVENPFAKEHIIYAGLIYEALRDMDKAVKTMEVKYVSPEILMETTEPLLRWIDDNQFKYVAIHWDVDSMSPYAYRSTYPAEPFHVIENFDCAFGRMKFDGIMRMMKEIQEKVEIVGINITENMPFDAINMRKAMSEIKIFN